MDTITEPQHQHAALAPDTSLDSSIPQKAKRKVSRLQQTHQASIIQRFVFDSILSLKQQCTNADTGVVVMDVKTAVAVHKLAGAWDGVADRLRILRGKGLPSSVKPASPRRAAEMKPLNDA